MIAEFEMVVDERETERQRDEAATKTMFRHLPQQPFERLRVYIVKLPSLFLFVHLCPSPTPTFEYLLCHSSFVSFFPFYFVLSFSSFFLFFFGGHIYIYNIFSLFFPIFKNFKNVRFFKKNVE